MEADDHHNHNHKPTKKLLLKGFEYIMVNSNLNGKFNSAQGSLRGMLILMKAMDDLLVMTPSCRHETSYKVFMEKVVRQVGELKHSASRRERLSAEIVCKRYMMEQKKVVSFEKIFFSAFVNTILEAEEEVGRKNTVIWMSMDSMYYAYKKLRLNMMTAVNAKKDDDDEDDDEHEHDHDTNTSALLRVMIEIPSFSESVWMCLLEYNEFESKMKALLLSAQGTLTIIITGTCIASSFSIALRHREEKIARIVNKAMALKLKIPSRRTTTKKKAAKGMMKRKQSAAASVQQGGFKWRFVCDLVKAELKKIHESMYGHIYFRDICLGFPLVYDS